MRNAEWFISEQENLIKEDKFKKEHILEVNKQWDKIERHLDTYKISPEDKYIVFKEPILIENENKLNDFGFFVINNQFISKIYFKEEDYNNDVNRYATKELTDESIYNLEDGKHENSRVDNVYNREKAKKDMSKVLNKSNDYKKEDKQESIFENFPCIKIEYNNKDGKENYKINDKEVDDKEVNYIAELLTEAIRSCRFKR